MLRCDFELAMTSRAASSKNFSAATTVSMRGARLPGFLLALEEVIASPETRVKYRIERLLGEGGFGQVYLASRVGRSRFVPATVCVKASERIDGWIREAYFGNLLDGHPRAIRLFDTFPLVQPGNRVLYCLTLEYARHGDLSAFLERAGRGWPESSVRREIAGTGSSGLSTATSYTLAVRIRSR